MTDSLWDEIMADASLGDVTFPLEKRGLAGGMEAGRIRPIYRAGQGIETTGRKPIVFDLQIPLYNGVEGHDDLYPDRLEQLLDVFLHAASDAVSYVDPILGTFEVLVESWAIAEDADHRDGCVVSVKLEEVAQASETFIILERAPIRVVAEASGALDDGLADLGVSDTTIANTLSAAGHPRGGSELWQAGNIMSSIATEFRYALEAGALNTDQLGGLVDVFNARVRSIAAMPELQGVDGWDAFAAALRLVDGAQQLAERALAHTAPIVEFTVTGTMSAHDVAVRMYGDGARADEVMRRQSALRPWAYTPGSTLRLPSR